VIGDGCLRFDHLAADDEQAGNWRAPLNSSWTNDTDGFGEGTEWFCQYRVKLGPDRLIEPNYSGGPGGFKLSIFGQYQFSSPNSSRSHTGHEIVIGNGFAAQGIYYAYRETTDEEGGGEDPFQVDVGGSIGIKLQPAVDHGSGTDNQRYCRYNGGNASVGCYFFTLDEWLTIYTRIKIAEFGGTTGNEFDMYFARPGDTQYTQLYNNRDFLIGTDNEAINGQNGIWFLPYDTGRASASYDTWHKHDQLIVSTQPIAVPA
jgi:hypothetical protein